MGSDATKIWNLRDGVRLIWRRLGDDYVVFNEVSGETHLPSTLSEWILREIETSPTTPEYLAEKLARDAGITLNLSRSRVSEVLAKFKEVGLVSPGQESIENL